MIERVGPSRIVFNVFNYAFMVLLCVVCLAPLWHVLMASVSNPRLLFASSGIIWLPLGTPTLQGYELVFKNGFIVGGYLNTLLYVGVNTVLGTVLTVIAGFVLSRPNLKLRMFFSMMVLLTLMFSGGLIPSYMINRSLGLVNNRLGVIIPGIINGFFIMIMRSAFTQLPASYEESAKLDGVRAR
jgi:putative aldouronate transport system permease protein